MKVQRSAGLVILVTLFSTLSAKGMLPTEDQSVQADVGAASKYVYNVFYDANRSVNDEALDVTPSLKLKSKPHFFTFTGDADGLFEQFATNTVQNHVDYDGNAQMTVNEEGHTSFRALGGYKSFSDPSPTETFGRIARSVASGGAGLNIRNEKNSSLDFSGRMALETFTIPNVSQYNATNLYNNTSLDGKIEYVNRFLPETSWFVRGSGGTKVFPNKPVFDPSTDLVFKNDSVYGLMEAGFLGRLTDRSMIDCSVGWLYRYYLPQISPIYGSFDTFSAPVFYLHFAEQITRRDQFTVGYDYKVDDSYFTNYYIDQDIYFGLVRVLGDQVLLLGRIGYDYRSYSLPFRRDDIRLTGSFSLKYSLSRFVKLTADLKIDLLSSDFYDNSPVPISPDRPLNYQAGSFALGLLANY